MKNFSKKLSAVVLITVFATMQVQASGAINTGLGVGNGGAVINGFTGGNMSVDKGTNQASLNFNGNSHVKWDTLNLNKGETLNFNAVNGATDLKILNTVNQNASKIYGAINANKGIGQLIISNPNGVLFDGAKFTASGDVMLTTQPMTATFNNNNMNILKTTQQGNLGFVTITNSDFEVGGQFNILAPSVNVIGGEVSANDGFKLITANGQDYLTNKNTNVKDAVKLEAVNIDGDVYIIADKGIIKTVNGGEIKGKLDVQGDDIIALNYVNNGNKLVVNGDTKVDGNGQMMYARNAEFKKNLDMKNTGGFVEIKDVKVAGNANLTTEGFPTENAGCCNEQYNHFVHVVGDTNVDGNLNINASQNIHIGGYDMANKQLLDGKLTVGGDLTAHSTDGHITTTIDTSANKISMTSDKLNILTDGEAVLSANEYQFASNGYIGGIVDTEQHTNDLQIISLMENYTYVRDNTVPGNVIIAGGEISKLNSPDRATVYIASQGDMKLTGANAGTVNLTSFGNDIEITGPDVHAKNINVGPETDTLTVDFPSRDYELKYTNIRDAQEVVIKGTDEITYELTNGDNGYNTRDPRPANTTYLTGPEKPVEPPVEPEPELPPVNPPELPPVYPPSSDPQTIPSDDNENVKILRNLDKDMLSSAVNANPVYTPIAYAADMDDDRMKSPIRKNVDGSVTVVRAQPLIN